MGEFWLLVLGNVWVSIGLVAMAFSPLFILLLVVSFLGGLGGGAQHPLASSMVSRAYDDKGRSTAVGTVNFAGDIGKMIAPAVAGLIAIQFGWRTTLWVVGLAGLAFMALSAAFHRSVNIGRPQVQSATTVQSSGGETQKNGFIMLSVIGFLDSATRGAALVFIPFVLDAKGVTPAQMSGLLVLLFVGGGIGKFVVGWLGDRFDTISLIWGTKGLTALMLVLSIWAPPLAVAPLMVVLGIGLNGTSSVLYATVAEFIPAHRRGRFYGLYYTTNEGGTVLAPIIYGLIADFSSLNITIIVMGVLTMAILPASVPMRKYLAAKIVASSG
jgi:MFS family permease